MTDAPTNPLPPHRDPWGPTPDDRTGTGGPGGTGDPLGDGAGAGQWPPTPVAPVPPPAPPTRDPARRRPAAALAATAVLAALLGGGAGAVTATALDDDPAQVMSSSSATGAQRTSDTGSVVPADGTTAEVAAQVLPSVVTIRAQGAGGAGTGSGVVLDTEGHVLTNNHVVEGAEQQGTLTVVLQDGRRADASIVGTDATADLAVLQVEGVDDLQPLALGSSADLQVGDTVLAVGAPLGLTGTVSEGIVSAKNRPVFAGGEQGGQASVLNAIQTDTAINPGNSGGALVDARGRLVGINSAIATVGGATGQSGNIGIGFAIPVDQATRIADELIADGTASYARIGAEVGDAQDGGAQLGTIEQGSAAEEAGLEAGDVVTRLDEQVVDGADALVSAVRSAVPGSTVELTYVRDGDERTVQVTLDTVESD
jgi:putative serine protease PepD